MDAPLERMRTNTKSMRKPYERSPMGTKPIPTKRDHRTALETVDRLMSAETGTSTGDTLDALVTLIRSYGAKHFPKLWKNPVEFIKLMIAQRGLPFHDLTPVFRPTNRAREVLSRKRPLCPEMIRKLHRKVGIAAEVLIAA